jgi:hypothetical protein
MRKSFTRINNHKHLDDTWRYEFVKTLPGNPNTTLAATIWHDHHRINRTIARQEEIDDDKEEDIDSDDENDVENYNVQCRMEL